jgi:hypothetical protein
MGKGFFLVGGILSQPGWIVKAVVDDFGLSRKKRTIFIGMTTNGDDKIKFPAVKLGGGLGKVGGDINSGLSHNLDG